MIDGEVNVLPLLWGMAILTQALGSMPNLGLDGWGEVSRSQG